MTTNGQVARQVGRLGDVGSLGTGVYCRYPAGQELTSAQVAQELPQLPLPESGGRRKCSTNAFASGDASGSSP